MAKIKNYLPDNNITDKDIVIGSDGDVNGATKNFNVATLKEHILKDIPDAPTKTSDLTNDGEDGVNPFITAQQIPATPTLEQVLTAGNTSSKDVVLSNTKKIKGTDGKKFFQVDANYARIMAYTGDDAFPDTEARVQVETDGAILIQGEATQINVKSAAITGQDLTFKGLEYTVDNSANFTDRSLVDKAYVDANSSKTLLEVTYSELLNLKNTSTLIKGQVYLLTDYMTTYTQPVTNVAKSSGIVEQLYITATDVNKLHNECKSKLYPQDVVYYEITGDIGNTVNGSPVGTEGFTKGKIYRRIDTHRNNDIGTDWRHVKYNRGAGDKLLFEDYTGCENNFIESCFLYHSEIGNYFVGNKITGYFFGNNLGQGFSVNSGVIQSTTTGIGFSGNTFTGIAACQFSDFFTGNNFESIVDNKDFTAYSELYSKSNYSHTIYRTSNGDVQYKWTNNFGDTIIEDVI